MSSHTYSLTSTLSYVPTPCSALEARHRQQLKELEEQVKSTWEAKFKVSEEHELARKRLEDEQAAARRQLGNIIPNHSILLTTLLVHLFGHTLYTYPHKSPLYHFLTPTHPFNTPSQ